MTASQFDQASSDGAERRKVKRHLVDDPIPITAVCGGRLHTCRITDVSMDGVRLQFDTPMPQARVIALEHPTAGTLCGTCVWSGQDSMGVELQLPKQELERLLKCISLIL